MFQKSYKIFLSSVNKIRKKKLLNKSLLKDQKTIYLLVLGRSMLHSSTLNR